MVSDLYAASVPKIPPKAKFVEAKKHFLYKEQIIFFNWYAKTKNCVAFCVDLVHFFKILDLGKYCVASKKWHFLYSEKSGSAKSWHNF